MLGFSEAPMMDPHQAGRKLGTLAKEYDFSLFEYWASDYAGHKQQMDNAIHLMETFDEVVDGLVEDLEGWFDPGHLRSWQYGGSFHSKAYGCKRACIGDR